MLNWLVKILTGGIDMVDLYVALIIAGRRIITQVPIKLRDAVLADLEALGLDGEGKLIERQ